MGFIVAHTAHTNHKYLVIVVPVYGMALTQEELLNAIRELADGDSPPKLEEMNEHGPYSSTTYYNHFESWNDALRKAGFGVNRSHNDKITKECEICGECFKVVQSYDGARFCSTQCHGIYQSREYSGEDHPRYTERVEVECHTCSESMLKTPNYASKFDRFFCSNECMAEQRAEGFKGPDNPKWSEEIEVECAHCGSIHNRLPFRVSGRENHFCSQECHREWQTEQTGADHPTWRGGATQYATYGPRWLTIREKIIESQDGRCRACGINRQELERDLHVHHITPVREFKNGSGDIDWGKANQEENLVALCQSCHHDWEGVPVVPSALSGS